MERFDRRLHVRVSEADVERARKLANTLNITTSALVRLLLQLPAEDVAAQRHVVLDLACANRLYRELNQWGYQQNQAAHALNRIAYYLRRGAMDASDVLEKLASVGRQLERLRERTGELAVSWAREHFGEHEVSIVYNIGHIPHAHVVANNINVFTGRRLQDPDPKKLKYSLCAGLDAEQARHRCDRTFLGLARRRLVAPVGSLPHAEQRGELALGKARQLAPAPQASGVEPNPHHGTSLRRSSGRRHPGRASAWRCTGRTRPRSSATSF